MANAATRAPIRAALVDDYDVVLKGLARMFDDYRDRVVVVEIDANEPIGNQVDVVLYDSFAQPESDRDEISVLVTNPRAHKSSYTPGTSIPTSSTAPPDVAWLVTSPRLWRRESWLPQSKQSMPASSSSAPPHRGCAVPRASIGPGVRKA